MLVEELHLLSILMGMKCVDPKFLISIETKLQFFILFELFWC